MQLLSTIVFSNYSNMKIKYNRRFIYFNLSRATMAGNLDIVHHGRIIGIWESGIGVRDIACYVRVPYNESNVRKWIKRKEWKD